jgi:exopolysaccharide biosynthesis polyprenyl glycosylphosphotransferase
MAVNVADSTGTHVDERGSIPGPRGSGISRTVGFSTRPPLSPDFTRRPTPRWMRRYIAAIATSDLGSAALAAVLTWTLPFAPVDATAGRYVMFASLFSIGWALVVHLCRGYEAAELTSGDQEFRHVLRAALWAMAMIAFFSYAADVRVARGLVVIGIPTAALLSVSGRYVARKGVHSLRRHGRCMKAVVAVGRERAVLDLVEQLERDQFCGMRVVAACVPQPAQAHLLRAAGVEVRGDLQHAGRIVREVGADVVAVTSSSETAAVFLRQLSWELEGSGVELLVAPGLMEVAGPRMHIRPFVGLPLLHVEEPEFSGAKRLVKGALDRVVATLALLVVAPALLLIALAVRLDSPGPALFRQTRIGRGGREFTMFKFRTMVVDAERRRAELVAANQNADGLLFKVAADPRVTRVGAVLRRYSVDEVPQLLNVLLGRMSLVGPRPPLPAEVEMYDDSVRRRLLVKPGLTGLWQVSGRSDLTWEQSVRLDLRYVENWSLLLDIMILWKTAFAVVRARGAY